jgi:hypothetical protein
MNGVLLSIRKENDNIIHLSFCMNVNAKNNPLGDIIQYFQPWRLEVLSIKQ